MHTEAVREKLFTMRMSAEEWARAENLAKHHGLTVAALVRMMLMEKERTLAVRGLLESGAASARPHPKKK